MSVEPLWPGLQTPGDVPPQSVEFCAQLVQAILPDSGLKDMPNEQNMHVIVTVFKVPYPALQMPIFDPPHPVVLGEQDVQA